MTFFRLTWRLTFFAIVFTVVTATTYTVQVNEAHAIFAAIGNAISNAFGGGGGMTRTEAHTQAAINNTLNDPEIVGVGNTVDGRWQATINPFTGNYGVGFYGLSEGGGSFYGGGNPYAGGGGAGDTNDPPPINGSCGSASGGTFTSAPSSSARCSSGSPSGVSAIGGLNDPNARWRWTCMGQNGGSNATCTANRRIHAECAPIASATNVTGQPSGNLCTRGVQGSVSGDPGTGWSWQCQGINGGTNSSCAPIGMCNVNNDHHPVYTPSVSAAFQDPSTSWGNTVTQAAPGDQVNITVSGSWSSSEAANYSDVSCNSNFGGNDMVITPGNEMGLGQSRTYNVSCTESLCDNTRSSSASVGIALPAFSTFIQNREIIRAGDTIDMTWNIEADGRAPYPLNCNLRGAITHNFSTPTQASGARTSPPLFNRFVNRIQCIEPITQASGQSVSSIEETSDVEVVPAIQER